MVRRPLTGHQAEWISIDLDLSISAPSVYNMMNRYVQRDRDRHGTSSVWGLRIKTLLIEEHTLNLYL